MKLIGKRITFLGDSITEGWGTSGVKFRYDNVLAEKAGLASIFTDGIGGTRIAYQRGASADPRWDLYFCGRAASLDLSGDVIVVFGGTNDFGHGNAPFGSKEDRTPDTFCGAVNWLMEMLMGRYQTAKVVFMTPMKRQGGELPSQVTGKTLAEYAAAIVEAGERCGVSVLDLYNTLGIDPDLEDDRTRYTIDGLHPNDAGHAKIAEALFRHLSAL